MSVSQKSLFLYSKDLVVSHVYSYIPYSKELVNSPVSRHCLLGKVGRLEGLKVGILECWKVGRSEGWKVQVMKGFCPFPKS